MCLAQVLRDAKVAHTDEVGRLRQNYEATLSTLQSAPAADHKRTLSRLRAELEDEHMAAMASAELAAETAVHVAAEGAARYKHKPAFCC